jgi:DNA-binding response OmpR family regulator
MGSRVSNTIRTTRATDLSASRGTKVAMAVLLVEDNPRLSAALARGMKECGFQVQVERTGRGALDRLEKHGADAVILDLGLPDIDGIEVLTTARGRGVLAPVLVLTARDAVTSRVGALESGADDYLIKPFAFEEMVARVRALVRRASAPRWAPLRFGDLQLDIERRVVLVGTQSVTLSPREHTLLHYLMRRRTEVSSRREILAEVFGYEFDPGTNVVEVHVAHLRRKLAGSNSRIETVRGAGYRLREAVEDENGGSS